ncbi:MerR family transcriptional regulator [Sulfurimonas sp.]|uniref:MerR family transcriptional regulator n=1 Tax=Sulfurimonas sp. TaxID=2022749 RepID=UPI0025F4A508|nr:MerR family transcriptional regulator [Sulfurimonas sp.]MCK9454072.1 MerR family transcriptional regulator [Sulfurimonas sp.]
MSELVAKTDVPKSTILYYIREGLLPQAKKIKSNVHRYSDEHIELIKYIQYMQKQLGRSIEQIRYSIQNRNKSFSSSFQMLEPLMNTLSGLPSYVEYFTKEQFIKKFDLDKDLVEKLLKDSILVPTSSDSFTEKEFSIVELVMNYQKVGVSYEILKSYALHANKLSKLDHLIKLQLCEARTDENFSSVWNIMFETFFNAKEYIFKRHTYKLLLNDLKNEVLESKEAEKPM